MLQIIGVILLIGLIGVLIQFVWGIITNPIVIVLIVLFTILWLIGKSSEKKKLQEAKNSFKEETSELFRSLDFESRDLMERVTELDTLMKDVQNDCSNKFISVKANILMVERVLIKSNKAIEIYKESKPLLADFTKHLELYSSLYEESNINDMSLQSEINDLKEIHSLADELIKESNYLILLDLKYSCEEGLNQLKTNTIEFSHKVSL